MITLHWYNHYTKIPSKVSLESETKKPNGPRNWLIIKNQFCPTQVDIQAILLIHEQTTSFAKYFAFTYLWSSTPEALSPNFCFTGSAQHSPLSMYCTEWWLLSCASETEIGWQRRQVWNYITKISYKIAKSGIWWKNWSLILIQGV